MSVITVNPRFNPGRLMITRNAKNALPRREVDAAINRHLSGDWGDVCQSDWQRNEQALRDGDRLLSVYQTQAGEKFWIITESDRSTTTVLLPSDC
ncbi:MAG: hypothetical protein OSJ58_10995 [Dysosmobacter sp.]|jgi:hypothetical protein|nr:hypothetical protein [Oscillospiraceae bacterium]MCI9290125.1 hypothetical protein [Oscillospiraceae bacterium]MCX4372336.1 hypothetical protein [Dysosmobacter sp.]